MNTFKPNAEQTIFQLEIAEIHHCVIRDTKPEWYLHDILHHNYYVYVYCMGGKGHYSLPSQHKISICEGEAMLIPKGLQHSIKSDLEESWKFGSCVFALKNDIDAFGIIGPYRVSSKVQKLFSELFVDWIAKRPCYSMRCNGALLQMLSELIERKYLSLKTKKVSQSNTILKALSIIDHNMRCDLSVEELAKSVNLSTSRFRHLFKLLVGESPIQYKNRVLMEYARELLISGDFNVSSVAFYLGYENIYYFSRLFKSIIGISPSKIMKEEYEEE